MLPTERIDYSAIPERAPLQLPDGARLAVWVIVNIEEWDSRETMPRTVLTPPAGGVPLPDIPNGAWHEYGNRVGFWRLLAVLDAHRIRAVLAINGKAIAAYEPIARAAQERGWEFIGHGFGQKNMQKVLDEREDIHKTAAAIRRFTGSDPRGWLGPGLTETCETPDLLVEEGFDYVCDWVLDDQFERLHADAQDSARIMALVVHPVHPYIMGAPHRLKYFRRAIERIRQHGDVLFWTGAQIVDWYSSQRPAPTPAPGA